MINALTDASLVTAYALALQGVAQIIRAYLRRSPARPSFRRHRPGARARL